MTCGSEGPTPIAVVGPAPGSSINNSASDALVVEALPSRRLVTFVPKLTVMLAAGTTELSASGLPPEQVSTMSPINSVKPSARSCGGTETAALHCREPVPADEEFTCAQASPANRASTAIAVIHLRKS